MSPLKPLPSDAKKIFQTKAYTIWQFEQKLYDGTTTTFERMQRADTAVILVVLPDKKLLITEDEQPDRDPVLTLPGGKVDPGETPEHAAHRELKEETGYETEKLIPWFKYSPETRTIWTVHFFIAKDVSKTSEQKLDAGERIKLLTISFDELLQLGHNPRFRDLTLRILFLEALLDSKKRAELEKLFYGN